MALPPRSQSFPNLCSVLACPVLLMEAGVGISAAEFTVLTYHCECQRGTPRREVTQVTLLPCTEGGTVLQEDGMKQRLNYCRLIFPGPNSLFPLGIKEFGSSSIRTILLPGQNLRVSCRIHQKCRNALTPRGDEPELSLKSNLPEQSQPEDTVVPEDICGPKSYLNFSTGKALGQNATHVCTPVPCQRV